MKIKITHSPKEKEEAAADLAVLLRRHPGAKVRWDKSKAPKLVVYMTIKSPNTLEPAPKA